MSDVLESSGFNTDNQTSLGETSTVSTQKDEIMLVADTFGGLQGEAVGERQAEEEPNAAKDVPAAGRVYNPQPYSGGGRYADRSGKVFYANSQFSSSSFQHRTNVLDDFHGRGWFETEFRLVN